MRNSIWLAAVAVGLAAAYESAGYLQSPPKPERLRAAVATQSSGTFAARNDYTFTLSIFGGFFPTISGTTNAEDGAAFAISIKRPWLPDAQERLAKGQAACGEDCLPATGPEGATAFVVKDGRFSAGPFSFNGKPFRPAEYPVEISRVLTNDVPTDRIKDIATPVFTSRFQLRNDGEARF